MTANSLTKMVNNDYVLIRLLRLYKMLAAIVLHMLILLAIDSVDYLPTNFVRM